VRKTVPRSAYKATSDFCSKFFNLVLVEMNMYKIRVCNLRVHMCKCVRVRVHICVCV
jgi:hypothetical protein